MDKDKRAAYGPIIRETRKAKGIDQETLAEMTGVSRRTIGSIERGDTVAQHEPLEKLLTALDLMPQKMDDDISAFLVIIATLLQQIDRSQRERVMQDVMGVALAEIRRGGKVTRLSAPVSDEAPNVPDAIAAHEDGSIAGEQESTNET